MAGIVKLDQMEWLQEGLYLGLLAAPLFERLNFVLERKFRLDKTVELDAIWQTPRGGSQGAGAMVTMPRVRTDKPNSQVNDLLGSVLVFENRDMNMTPGTGTGRTAEQWASCIGEFMRGWIMGQMGGLVPEPAFIAPDDEWIKPDDGIMVLRVSISQRQQRKIFKRPAAAPVFAINNNYMVTLTPCPDFPEATVYYTTDGSFPGNPEDVEAMQGEDPVGASQVYDGPFQVAAGDIVAWMAVGGGADFPSNVGIQTIT